MLTLKRSTHSTDSVDETCSLNHYTKVKQYFDEYAKNSDNDNSVFKIFFRQDACSDDPIELEQYNALRKHAFRWNQCPIIQKDSKSYPVLAYALAGNISEKKFGWLLEKLEPGEIQNYVAQLPLIDILATFGNKERVKLFKRKCSFSPEHVKKGVLIATYYGRIEVFDELLNINRINQVKTPLLNNVNIDTLTDNDGNTLLHVAILGQQKSMIGKLLTTTGTDFLEKRNKRHYRPIDLAVLSEDIEIFKEIHRFYNAYNNETPVSTWITLIIKESVFKEYYIERLEYFLKSALSTTDADTKRETLIIEAIKIRNITVIQHFISTFPPRMKINLLFFDHIPNGDRSIRSVITAEKQWRGWLRDMQTEILKRFKAYIERSNFPRDLKLLAQEDGETTPYPSHTLALDYFLKKHRSDRLVLCATLLEELFYDDHFDELKQIYDNAQIDQQQKASEFLKNIQLKRRILIEAIKKDTGNAQSLNFKDQLWSMLTKQYSPTENKNSFITNTPSPTYSSTPTPTLLNNSNEKRKAFVHTFVEEFEKTCRFFLSLHDGLVQINETDRWMDLIKKATALVPTAHVSLKDLGMPIPFSVDLPLGAIVSSIIDIYDYLCKQHQLRQADQLSSFFKRMSLREKVDTLYRCAEKTAEQFSEQLSALSSAREGIHYFAQVTVIRIFDYMLKNETNIQLEKRSSIGTLSRRIGSLVAAGNPDPEIIFKSLDQIVNDALRQENHYIFTKQDPEEQQLILDDSYSSYSTDRNRQWTSKGIFEHTGVRSKNNGNMTYANNNLDVEKYGYHNSTMEEAEEEIRNRGMKPCSKIPWFEGNTKDNNHRLYSLNGKQAFMPPSTAATSGNFGCSSATSVQKMI